MYSFNKKKCAIDSKFISSCILFFSFIKFYYRIYNYSWIISTDDQILLIELGVSIRSCVCLIISPDNIINSSD